MQLTRFKYNDEIKIGLINDDQQIFETNVQDMIQLIKDNDISINDIKYKLEDVSLLSPIEHTVHDIICVGVNYLDHLKESLNILDEVKANQNRSNVYFGKRANYLLGTNDDIITNSDSVDYEVELAVIIGKEALNVNEKDALDYIFGYSIFNDLSQRKLQKEHVQWYKGKSLDGFSILGPSIVLRDSLIHPLELDIKCYVNDELRQNSNTKHMIAGVGKIISELSQGMKLVPGDIIATGTPAGVGMGFTPPKYLKHGDVIRCEIEGIGILENTIINQD